jgi:hypothetical protein
MDNRLKFAALVAIAILALAGSVVLLYGYVTNDWRLSEGLRQLHLFSGEEEEPDARVASRRWEFDWHGGNVNITTDMANVQIVHADVPKATVDVLLEGEATDSTRYAVSAQQDAPSMLTITAEGYGTTAAGVYRAARMTVTLPSTNDLKVTASRGTLAVNGISGSLQATVTGPELRLVGVTGSVDIKCIEGNISVERSAISGNAVADRGTISMSYTDGSLVLSATSGISAHNHQGELSANVTEGPIDIELIGDNVRSRLVSGRGNITLALLPSVQATFDAESITGRVYASVPLDTADMVVPQPNILQARMNGGGAPVMIRASGGDINILTYGESQLLSSPDSTSS